MQLFISGPMRGCYEFNKAAFTTAQRQAEALGHTVYNPHHQDQTVGGHNWDGCKGTQEELDAAGFNMTAAMFDNIKWVGETADGVLVLDGWTRSTGACAEVAFAVSLGKPVFRINEELLIGVTVTPAQTVQYADVWLLPGVDGPWPWPEEIPGQQVLAA